MFDGPLLWFLNRGTGVVLLVLMTFTMVLGVLATQARAGRGLPGFVSQHLHRNISLVSLLLLGAHVASAVVDTYVDITWWQAILPWGGTYKPLWLGLGALGLDLTVVLVGTSLVRARLPEWLWRYVHLTAYLAWGVALVHGLGIGTDSAATWSRWVTLGCVAAVLVAFVVRVIRGAVANATGRLS